MHNFKDSRIDGNMISKRLSFIPVDVRVFPTLDSTNTEAKRRAFDGADTPLLIIAERQSAGRGRMGRSFYSPQGPGLYMSLLLGIAGGFPDTVGITSAAAVAAVRAKTNRGRHYGKGFDKIQAEQSSVNNNTDP